MQNEHVSTELTVLNYIGQHADATQREISEHAGVSLGTINLLLKRMVKKGLVKIERLQPTSIKYFLTPMGIASKVERTYKYVVGACRELSRLKVRLAEVTELLLARNKVDTVVFFGSRDELFYLMQDLVAEKEFQGKLMLIDEVISLIRYIKSTSSCLTAVWSREVERLLETEHIKAVNILRMLVV
jgi:DNA-binding MarR family transcriptional regulator